MGGIDCKSRYKEYELRNTSDKINLPMFSTRGDLLIFEVFFMNEEYIYTLKIVA